MADRNIEIDGSIHMGREYKLIEEIEQEDNTSEKKKYTTHSGSGFIAPHKRIGQNSGNQHPSFERLSNNLQPTSNPISISNKGLTTAYGIFGQPGKGKTYLLKHMLRNIFALNKNDKSKRYGGLIIDPKCDFIEFLRDEIKNAGRPEDDLIIINGPTLRNTKPINLLHAPISPRDIGKLMALVCCAITPMEDGSYWFNNLGRVLGAVCDCIQILYKEKPTIRLIVAIITKINPKTKENVLNGLIRTIDSKLRSKDSKMDANVKKTLQIHLATLQGFLSDEKAYVQKNLLNQAFEEFHFPENEIYSAHTKIDDSSISIYEQAIKDGKIIVVSPPQEEVAIRRTLCALTKCFFQQIVLSRFTITQFKKTERPVFLVVDEYHTVASDQTDQGFGDNYFVSQARQFGCFTLFVTQNVLQLETSQLGKNWEALFSNLLAKFFFNVGDNRTSSYASELAGSTRYTITTETMTSSKNGTALGKSINDGERKDLPQKVLTAVLEQGYVVSVGSLDGGISANKLIFFKATE